MKIIQVIPRFMLAGAEIMCDNLIFELVKMGHEVIVISLFTYHSPITERLEKRGVDIRYLDKKLGLDLSIYKKLYSIFREEKPDVIHTHLYTMRYVVPAAIKARIPVRIHTVHSVARKESNKIGRMLAYVFFKFFRVVPVALSKEIQKTIIDEYHLDIDRVPIIQNGIDLSKCNPKTDYSIRDRVVILHIGRFVEPKNHLGLLKAFECFVKKYPNSILRLIGDGEKREEIETYVDNNGLSDNVEFLGLQWNVFDYLHNADIFALPSIYEGLPITLIEAMGTALPIVATNVGGIPDILNNGIDAIIVPPEIQKIYDALVLYTESESLRSTHGKNAKLSSEKYTSCQMAVKYLALNNLCLEKWKGKNE